MKRAFSDYWSFSPLLYSEKTDLYICHCEVAVTGKVEEIHQIRPDVVCLLYRNMRAIKEESPEFQMALDGNWILKDSKGQLIRETVYGGVTVDKGNLDYQDWVADWIKSYLDQYGFDGVYTDRNLYNTVWFAFWGTTWTSGETGPPINPRTGQVYTDAEYTADQIALTNKVKDRIYPRLLVCNGIIQGQRFFQYGLADTLLNTKLDGVVSEYLFSNDEYAQWYSESKWKASLDYIAWLEKNFLFRNKIFLPGMSHANSPSTLPADCTQEQYMTYAFASLFLAAKNFSQYYPYLGDGSQYGMQDYPQNLFKLDLGKPVNDYYVVTGTHVYARDFSKTKILVNPTTQSYSISLNGSYMTLDGASVKSPLTLNPHTGMILKSAQISAFAHVYVTHTYRGDLVVDIGVGDPANPTWSTRIWNRSGGSADDLDLTVDLSAAATHLPPSESEKWFVKVYDAARGDVGQIIAFTMTYQDNVYSSNDVPVPINDLGTSYAFIPSLAQAHVYIEHTYRGDLIVDVGVGSTSSPLWSKRVWNGTGGGTDNLDLTVDLSAGAAYLPPSVTYSWWLKVYDRAAQDTGRIVEFTVTNNGAAYVSIDVPVPILDKQTSYAFIPSLASAHVYIEHTYRGDLIVDVGVGSTSSPLWSKRVWNGTGSGADNLDLYVGLSSAVAYLPPSGTYTWWVKVYDKAAGDQGKTVTFTIAYQAKTYTSPTTPVPIYDLKTSYAYISS
jgi:subtilisin-like proprotein convertase family protein